MKSHLLRFAVLACTGSLLAAAAMAQPMPAAEDLPPETRVRDALLARAELRASRAAVEAEQAEAQRLRRGPEEFVVRAGAQQRRTDEADPVNPGRRRFAESQVALERTWRSGAKAAQDDAIGRAGVELARLEAADAAHEASRGLLRQWFDWLRERASVALWREQVQAQEQLVAQAARRVKAGDAARSELHLQEAARAQVNASLAAALVREASSRAALDLNWPGLTAFAPDAPRTPRTSDVAPAADDAVQSVLEERSHELLAARAREQLAQARASRVALDARPDPTFGVHVGSERGGAERIVGVTLSIPLAGAARTDAARAMAARADEAALRRQAVHVKVRTQATADRLAAQAALDVWRSQEEARARLADTVTLLQRGWQLGELAQSDALLARRQYVDAALAELAARAEARHAALRLQLDLHRLWDLDD